MSGRVTTGLVALFCAAPCACGPWLAPFCQEEQLACVEQQHAACAATWSTPEWEPEQRNLQLELGPVQARRACQAAPARYELQRYDEGTGEVSYAESGAELDGERCWLRFEARDEEFDPKLERHVLVGGADARVRLCHASLAISQARSYGDVSPQLAQASILSGDEMHPLLGEPVVLHVQSPGGLPAGCAQPLADQELDEVYSAWQLEISLTIQELQRLFGGIEQPTLRTTWLIEERR
jgi:hypothetical protein